MMTARRSTWTAARLFLALLVTLGIGRAQESSTEPDLQAVVARAREAARRENWLAHPGGLELRGSGEVGGLEARFLLSFERDGRFRFELDGRLTQLVLFDGRTVAQRQRRGPMLPLEMGEREEWQLAQWLHSGYWIDEAAPLCFESVRRVEEGVLLELHLVGSRSRSSVLLHPRTWLPIELRQEDLGSERRLTFSDYEEVGGVPIANRVTSRAHGDGSDLRIDGAAFSTGAPVDRYVVDVAPPKDTHFLPGRPASVEVRRVVSGHLLVHPMVEEEDVGWFILDSGAGQICIDPAVADRLQLEAFGSVPAVGVAGRVEARFRQGGSLELGPLRIEDPVYVELDLAFLTPIFGVDVAGIAGFDVFARAVLELDLEAPSLALHDPATYELRAGSWSELALDNSVPCISCRFEGDRTGLFKLDLGDSGTISFYSPAVREFGLLEGRAVTESNVSGVGGSGRASTGTLEWFEVGGHRTEQLPVTFSLTEEGVFSSSGALGNLGSHMLRPFRIVFDYRHVRIALVPRETE